jgi:hypothetical protein
MRKLPKTEKLITRLRPLFGPQFLIAWVRPMIEGYRLKP